MRHLRGRGYAPASLPRHAWSTSACFSSSDRLSCASICSRSTSVGLQGGGGEQAAAIADRCFGCCHCCCTICTAPATPSCHPLPPHIVCTTLSMLLRRPSATRPGSATRSSGVRSSGSSLSPGWPCWLGPCRAAERIWGGGRGGQTRLGEALAQGSWPGDLPSCRLNPTQSPARAVSRPATCRLWGLSA